MKKLILGIAPALFLLLVLWPSPVAAQELDLTVSPVSLDFSPDPGQVIKDKVTIHNNTSSPMTLDLSVARMTVDDQGRIVPQDLTPDSTQTSWIKFNSAQITAPAKEWLDVPFTITVPTDAAYGNYFALVFTPPAVQPQTGTTLVQGNVLVPILLSVKSSGTIRQASITDFSVDNFVSQYPPISFSVSVKNTGNVHVHPRGNIFIRGAGQKDIAVLEVNPGQGNILPTATRTFTAQWSDGFIVRDAATGHLTINWNKLTDFRLGKYTAYVLLAYDDGQRDVPLDATLTFWVFPYVAVAVILGAIILVTLIIVYGFKALVRKEARKLQS